MNPMVPETTSNERQPPNKATLYCTNCTHTSRINGEWVLHVHESHLEYECPDCGTTIDSRDRARLSRQSHGVLQL